MAWSLGGQGATLAFTMIGTVALARLLTPIETGAFAFSIAMYALVQSLLQFGMANYILRTPELTPKRANAAMTLAILQGLAASLLMAVTAPVAGALSRQDHITEISLLVALAPMLSGPEAVCEAFWAREGQFRTIAVLNTLKALVQSGVSILTAIWGWGAFALAAGFVANGLFSFVWCVVALLARGIRLHLDREEWQLLKGYSANSMLLTITVTLNMRIADLFIGRIFTLGALGQYSRANGTIDMLRKTISYPTARVFVPRMMNAVHEGLPLTHSISDLRRAFLFILWPALAGLAVIAHPVTRLLYGPQWDFSADILVILCLVVGFDTARAGGMEGLLYADRLRFNNGIEFVRLIVNVALLFAALPFGLMAVLWTRVIEAALAFAFYLAALHRIGAGDVRRELRDFAEHGFLALLAAGPAWIFMSWRGWPGSLSFWGFATVISLGALAFLVGALLLRHSAVAFIPALLGARAGGGGKEGDGHPGRA